MNKTNKLLDDRQLAATMGEAARREMIENYPVEEMVNRHATLFRELVGSQLQRIPSNRQAYVRHRRRHLERSARGD